MNIDLTPEEIAHVVKMCEAGNMGESVNGSVHFKCMKCLALYKPSTAPAPLPEAGPDPRLSAQQWKSPI
jgi:hypothetical protein